MIIFIKRVIKTAFSYEIVRYGMGGFVAFIMDLLIFYLLTDFLGIRYMLSAMISFVISVSVAYIYQKYVTFRNMSKKHIQQGGLFLIFQLIGQGIYMIVLWLGVDILGFYYMFVAVVGKLIAFIRNYLSNRYFNFKK